MTVRLTILCGLLAGVAGAVAAGAAGSPSGATGLGDDYAETQPICRKLGKPVLPRADRPTAAQRAALKGCNSEKLYYGEGVKPDYVRARLCAAIEAEGKEEEQPIFGGSTILMQVYANGLGVKRNPDLAIAYSCHIWAAPAEFDIRTEALQALKKKPEHIDFCDSLTSGFAAGACAARESRIAAVPREAGIARTVAALPPAGRSAYPAMRKAFDAFVEASGFGEVDTSGTMRGVFITAARDALNDQFAIDLGRLRTGKWPVASAAEAADADAKLNTTYRAMLDWAGRDDNGSSITADDIRKTQRLWLVWRDAYVRFAAAAAPGVSRDAVLARLTRLRLAQFEKIRNGDEEG